QSLRARAAYEARGHYIALGRIAPQADARSNEPPPSAGIKALDPETGRTIWDFKLARPSLQNGVMATAGGVVFAASRDGDLIALDAQTGTSLWRYQTGGNMRASPMSFAVEDRQYVAIASGDTIYCFALPK